MGHATMEPFLQDIEGWPRGRSSYLKSENESELKILYKYQMFVQEIR